jgi:hypothetical protein
MEVMFCTRWQPPVHHRIDPVWLGSISWPIHPWRLETPTGKDTADLPIAFQPL